MRILLSVVAILFILAGAVFFLQGLSILPGTYMVGQTRWVIYGAVIALVGGGLLFVSRKRG